MDYAKELQRILDKCELTIEERTAFEDFMDLKVYKIDDGYENLNGNLLIDVQRNPILNSAQKRIFGHGQWREILKLAHCMHAT